MVTIAWDDRSNVNVHEIDAQHRQLVSLINQLNEAMLLRQGRAALTEILARLIDETRAHFAAEETLMIAHAYPDYEGHRQQHEKLLKQIVALHKEFEAGDILLSFAIMLDLKAWALRHISSSDKRLGLYLNDKDIF